MARFALLTDWLGGRLSDDDDFTRSIARCFCVGDVVCLDPAAAKGRERTARALDNKNGDTEDKHTVLAPVRAADVRLARLASLLPTACLPGARDPTSFALPQQPLHPLLLPEANRYSTFTSLTNPAESTVGGRSLLAHAGQPVTDFLRSASYEQGGAERVMGDGAKCTQRHVDGDADDAFLACLEDTLWWRHAAPTAPDTLPSYPFKDGDPFVMEDRPTSAVAARRPSPRPSLPRKRAGLRAPGVPAVLRGDGRLRGLGSGDGGGRAAAFSTTGGRGRAAASGVGLGVVGQLDVVRCTLALLYGAWKVPCVFGRG